MRGLITQLGRANKSYLGCYFNYFVFGVQVVDNSSAFRMTEGVPLVIPEVNPDAMKGMRYGQGGIIANPNCSTIIALMAVTPLHRAAKVFRSSSAKSYDWSSQQ